MSDVLARLITTSSLASLAGERSYERGLAYFEHGAVLDLVQTRDTLKARVQGNDEYRVTLRAAGRRLEGSCTCPMGEDGEFCKHAVAVGLAWLARREKDGSSSENPPSGGDELAPIRAYLGSQGKDALIERLLEQAAENPELRARLQAEALRVSVPTDLKAQKEIVRRALTVHGGFVDYQGMPTFVARAESVVELLRGLVDTGQARRAMDLADYAVRRGIAAYERTDDSNGDFGETLGSLAALHLEACRAAAADGEALGEALFELQMFDDWGYFAFEDYAPLLGQKGLAQYRSLAETAWRKVTAIKPGDRREIGSRPFRLIRMMEALARWDGDTDALIAVKAQDLSHVYAFVEIANILTTAKRHDDALVWAERGRNAFPKESDSRLVDFLVDAYRRAHRNEEAIAVAWEHFARSPGLDAYKLLRSACGATAWSAWCDKALAHVRSCLESGTRQNRWHWGGHSLLVEIFLEEGDSGAALAEAKAGGCAETLWMAIAAAREAEHPQDAIAIYQARIDPIVKRANNRAYDDATVLVGKIQSLMKRAGKESECKAWIEGVRAKHKAKRNFMQRLESVAAGGGA